MVGGGCHWGGVVGGIVTVLHPCMCWCSDVNSTVVQQGLSAKSERWLGLECIECSYTVVH